MSANGRRSSAWLALALLGASPAPRAHTAPGPLPPRPTQYATDRAQVFPPPGSRPSTRSWPPSSA
jgi:hypothetical protein